MAHLYISHSAVDLDPLLKLHEALRRAGISAWYPSSPDAAANTDLVREKMDEAFAVAVLVSADAMRSAEVQRDIELAISRGVKLVPIRLDKARPHGAVKHHLAPLMKHDMDDPEAIAALIDDLRGLYRKRCPVLAVMNLKGGVGKTTLTAQIFGAYQAEHGSRVLLIDLDPQYNLTQLFFDMVEADARAERDQSVISLFERSMIHATGEASPASDWTRLSREPFNLPDLSVLAHPLLGDNGPAGRLDLITGQFEISKYAFATDAPALAAIKANFLGQIEALRSQYDLIVFDTNPNATFLTQCALEAVDRVVAPMHPDIYSLRGVRLLNQVIREQVAPHLAPDLSVMFNGVQRREQSVFEADARNGIFDARAGFELSKALIGTAIPRSNHLVVSPPEEDMPQWRQLLVHHGRGGGLKPIRESLNFVASELATLAAKHIGDGRAAA